MAYKSLSEFITALDHEGELVRIKRFVDPVLEITEITDRESKKKGGGKALLFENTGTDFPVLTNAMGSDKRIAMALSSTDVISIGEEIESLIKKVTSPANSLFDKLRLLPTLYDVSTWMPKNKSGRGACQEVINREPDLSEIPVLKCWPADGGRFVTLPMVITRDLESGIRNVGMYRMQIFDKDLTGMHWHRHKVGARHYNQYKEAGKRMPVAVAIGGDPVYTYSATAPMPDNVDEFMLAGFLRKKKVSLVKCITNDLEVPEDCDFVIEGYVDPAEEYIWEGPFGDHTGFYSLADWYPRFHVTCITHKRKAVYPATIVGIPPQEDAYIAKATERIFLPLIRFTMLPEMEDMYIPPVGVAHNLTLVSINKSFPGQALKVANSLWGAGQMMFNKLLCVFDADTNIYSKDDVLRLFSERVSPVKDVHVSYGPLDVLDHSSDSFGYGSKACFDLTQVYTEENRESVINERGNKIDADKIKHISDSIVKVNSDYINLGYSILLITVDKSKGRSAKDIIADMVASDVTADVKFVIVLDAETDSMPDNILAWLILSNIDAKRDFTIKETTDQLFVDATFKSSTIDGFKRDWPNVVTSADDTISAIDSYASELNLGSDFESPSKNIKVLVKNNSAIADDTH